jgi:catechol 2,3-dioxygenase-like lactoylglutathione lyase family enzyme
MLTRYGVALAALCGLILSADSPQLHAQKSSGSKSETGTATRPSIASISHLSVYSSDLAKTEHFYVHDLGAVKRGDPENPQGTRYYFNPIQFVEVLPLPSGPPSINRLDHVAYNTSKADDLRLYLAAHGVEVPKQVESGSDGSHWFDVIDPEGNKVEFVQPPTRPSPVPANPLSSHIIHVGYLVHSRSAEDAFYRTVLGFRPYWFGGKTDTVVDWVSQQVPDGTDWIEYMVVSGPETRGIPATMSQDNLGVLNHFSLGVDNIEKSVDLLWSGDSLTGKHSSAQIGRDGKWQFNMYDPDGTRAEIMEFQPSVKPCCSEFTASSPKR